MDEVFIILLEVDNYFFGTFDWSSVDGDFKTDSLLWDPIRWGARGCGRATLRPPTDRTDFWFSFYNH